MNQKHKSFKKREDVIKAIWEMSTVQIPCRSIITSFQTKTNRNQGLRFPVNVFGANTGCYSFCCFFLFSAPNSPISTQVSLCSHAVHQLKVMCFSFFQVILQRDQLLRLMQSAAQWWEESGWKGEWQILLSSTATNRRALFAAYFAKAYCNNCFYNLKIMKTDFFFRVSEFRCLKWVGRVVFYA